MNVHPPTPDGKFLDPWYQSSLCTPVVIPSGSILTVDRVYFKDKIPVVILKMTLGEGRYRLLCSLSDINQMEYEIV